MTYYQRAPDFVEVAQLVKEFQTRVKKLKTATQRFSGERKEAQAVMEEREALLQASKQIISGLREERVSQVERTQQQKLAKEFQLILQTFHELNSVALNEQLEAVASETPGRQEQKQEQIEGLEAVGGYDELVLRQRGEIVEKLEKEVSAVNKLLSDVAKMVNEQGEQLNQAEDFVDRAVQDSGNAVHELRQADRQSSRLSSKTMCIMLVVLIAAAVLLLPILFMLWHGDT